jgi:hypothetical protein
VAAEPEAPAPAEAPEEAPAEAPEADSTPPDPEQPA